MIRIVIFLALLMPAETMAQQATFYDSRTGKAITRSTTDTQGTTVHYDAASGKVISRESRDGTVYGGDGRAVGKISKDRR